MTCRERWPRASRGTRPSTAPSRRAGSTAAGWCGTTSSVDWAAADVIAVRSAWDYDARSGSSSAGRPGVGPALLNGVGVFRWNVDKRYLVDLQDSRPAGRPDDRGRHRVRRTPAAADRFRLSPWSSRASVPAAAGSRSSPTAGSGCRSRTAPGPLDRPAAGGVHPPRRRDLGLRHRRAPGQPGRQAARAPPTSGCTSSSAVRRAPVAADRGGRDARGGGDRHRRRPARRRDRLRPGRHDAVPGPAGGERGRADRARPLPRRAARSTPLPFADVVAATAAR